MKKYILPILFLLLLYIDLALWHFCPSNPLLGIIIKITVIIGILNIISAVINSFIQDETYFLKVSMMLNYLLIPFYAIYIVESVFTSIAVAAFLFVLGPIACLVVGWAIYSVGAVYSLIYIIKTRKTSGIFTILHCFLQPCLEIGFWDYMYIVAIRDKKYLRLTALAGIIKMLLTIYIIIYLLF